MTAFNIVRFRVKPGREQDFIEAHSNMGERPKGARRFVLVRTGDHQFCALGEWESFDDLAAARPRMIGMLDSFRDLLEDMGGDLGVTDPISGEAVLEMGGPARKARATGGARRKAPAKRRAAAKRAKPGARKKPGPKPGRKAGRKPARKTAARRARR
jgi:hypothetical protein